MGDRFYKDIEVPDLPEGVELEPPQAGFLQIFGRGGKLATVNQAGEEVIHDGGVGDGVQTQLNIDGGNAATTFQNYLLRLDFGAGGASINPTGAL